ncbi:hypothetical protein ABZ383_32070 [Streptomyces sp. NPDC005900]|uniref:hypothetical protein n=1 Tax=Streptomyces sp. NPDC005900 TaxID=3154569 RepID=UPI0033FED7BD
MPSFALPDRRTAMPDLLTALAPPLILYAATVYAVVVHLRDKSRRRQGVSPRHRTPASATRERLLDEVKAYQQLRADAEQIITDAYKQFAPLYETPTRQHARH